MSLVAANAIKLNKALLCGIVRNLRVLQSYPRSTLLAAPVKLYFHFPPTGGSERAAFRQLRHAGAWHGHHVQPGREGGKNRGQYRLLPARVERLPVCVEVDTARPSPSLLGRGRHSSPFGERRVLKKKSCFTGINIRCCA